MDTKIMIFAIILLFAAIGYVEYHLKETRGECVCECECPEVGPSHNYYEYYYNLTADGGGATICMDDRCEYNNGELVCTND